MLQVPREELEHQAVVGRLIWAAVQPGTSQELVGEAFEVEARAGLARGDVGEELVSLRGRVALWIVRDVLDPARDRVADRETERDRLAAVLEGASVGGDPGGELLLVVRVVHRGVAPARHERWHDEVVRLRRIVEARRDAWERRYGTGAGGWMPIPRYGTFARRPNGRLPPDSDPEAAKSRDAGAGS